MEESDQLTPDQGPAAETPAVEAPPAPAAAPETPPGHLRSLRKVREGTVTSARQDKTIVVRVERRTAHPVYQKVVTSNKKYHAHDPNNEARKGDLVRIMETRPLSKLKRWRLVEIVRRAEEE